MPDLTVSVQKLSDTLYRITVTANTAVGACQATCFDRYNSCRSVLLGGDLFSDGDPERSMVEFSLDNSTYTKVCGYKRTLQIANSLSSGQSVQFYMRINAQEGVPLTGEKLIVAVVYSKTITSF